MFTDYIKRKIALNKIIKDLEAQDYQVVFKDKSIVQLHHIEGCGNVTEHLFKGLTPPTIEIDKQTLNFNNGWLSILGDSDFSTILDYLYKKYKIAFNQPLSEKALFSLNEYCNVSYLKISDIVKPNLKSLLKGKLKFISLSELRSLEFHPLEFNLERVIADSIRENEESVICTFYTYGYKCRMEIAIDVFSGEIYQVRTMPRVSLSGFFRPEEKFKLRNYRHVYKGEDGLLSDKVGQMYFLHMSDENKDDFLKFQSNMINYQSE